MAPTVQFGMQNGKRELREKLRDIPLPGTGQVPRFISNIPRYQVCTVTYTKGTKSEEFAHIMSGSCKHQGELQPYEITK